MQVKVVLVEPEYEENIGLIARAMKNFGCSELLLVNPKIDYCSGLAKSRAMHAQEILKNAKKFNSLAEALKQTDYSVATSAKITCEKKISRTAINVKELAKNFSNKKAALAIVFGREGTGLTNKELTECDFLVKIPSSHKYKTLNVSHSVAVILYEFFTCKEKGKIKADMLESYKKRCDYVHGRSLNVPEKYNCLLRNTLRISLLSFFGLSEFYDSNTKREKLLKSLDSVFDIGMAENIQIQAEDFLSLARPYIFLNNNTE